jgi:hypothetical protein
VRRIVVNQYGVTVKYVTGNTAKNVLGRSEASKKQARRQEAEDRRGVGQFLATCCNETLIRTCNPQQLPL